MSRTEVKLHPNIEKDFATFRLIARETKQRNEHKECIPCKSNVSESLTFSRAASSIKIVKGSLGSSTLETKDSVNNSMSSSTNHLHKSSNNSIAKEKQIPLDMCGQICGINFYISYGRPSTDRFKININQEKLIIGQTKEQYKHNRICLREYQVNHFNRMCDILTKYLVAYDYSKPGRGKTIISGAISSHFRMPMLIICPAIAETEVWAKEAVKYGWNVIDIISFDRLRGQYGRDCKHIYFKRTGNDFIAKPELTNLLDNGVLVVIDEISKLKNPKTGVKRVVHNLIREIVLSNKRMLNRNSNNRYGSRAVLLSAMPCDQPSHFPSLCQVLGLTLQHDMYYHDNSTKSYELRGYQDIVNWCHKIDTNKTLSVLNRYDQINKLTIPNIIMNLYDSVIRDEITSCMPSDIIPASCIKNGFYAVSPTDVNILRDFQHRIIREVDNRITLNNDTEQLNEYNHYSPNINSNDVEKVSYDLTSNDNLTSNDDLTSKNDSSVDDLSVDNSSVDDPSVDEGIISNRVVAILTGRSRNWSQVTSTLKILGKAKMRLLYRLAKDDLMSNPNRKVIIGVWYIDHIRWMIKALKEYGALAIYGDIPKKSRKLMIDIFQQPNNTCRVLIINPTVVGMCVPLDDQYGGFPRSEYILPDYRVSEIVQTTGRVLRETTKSPEQTKIRIVYAAQFKEELKIINTSYAKSINGRQAISGCSGLTLPNEYGIEEVLNYEEPDYELPSVDMLNKVSRYENYDVWSLQEQVSSNKS